MGVCGRAASSEGFCLAVEKQKVGRSEEIDRTGARTFRFGFSPKKLPYVLHGATTRSHESMKHDSDWTLIMPLSTEPPLVAVAHTDHRVVSSDMSSDNNRDSARIILRRVCVSVCHCDLFFSGSAHSREPLIHARISLPGRRRRLSISTKYLAVS